MDGENNQPSAILFTSARKTVWGISFMLTYSYVIKEHLMAASTHLASLVDIIAPGACLCWSNLFENNIYERFEKRVPEKSGPAGWWHQRLEHTAHFD
jgi:hypothetical protein